MHPDGYVELRDRAKDVVISGGENISTIEVEQAVVSHPAVLEVAVIGVPDEKWGERPKAFVVLAAGGERHRGRADRARQVEDRPVQGAEGGGDRRRAAQDLHRQGAEVRAAREGVGRGEPAGSAADPALCQARPGRTRPMYQPFQTIRPTKAAMSSPSDAPTPISTGSR